MNTRMLVGLLALSLLVSLAGCGGGGGGGGASNKGLTHEQIVQIENSSNAINTKLAANVDPTSDTALQDAKTFAKSQATVQDAKVIDGNLVVKYKDGGQEIWINKTTLPTPPADIAEIQQLTKSIASAVSQTKSPVGTRRAVLINALQNDPGFDSFKPVFVDIENTLVAAGFVVEKLYGPDGNPDSLRSLNDCSVVVMLGHGGLGDGLSNSQPYSVQTGAEWEWYSSKSSDWVAGRITKMNVGWGVGTDEQRNGNPKYFAAVTGKYWLNSYSGHHFNNALFLNLACSGAKHESYRQSLFSVGVGAYTGWTEPQGISPYTAWYTLALMAEGKSLQQAVDGLPNWYKSQSNDNGLTAQLWYGPDSGKSITLGGTTQEHPEVVIYAPLDGVSISGREVTVEGMISPWPANLQTQIIVNGQSSHLEIASNGMFSQPVGLRAGSNTIVVRAIGAAAHSSQVVVNGEFSSDILYTALWWNTDINDIDFHLKPIEGAGGATDECYFSNKTPSWGAVLDVDDVNGFGPEHITASSLPAGKYRLYVHYYDTHGQTEPSVVNVAVSVNGQPSSIFSLKGGRHMTTVGDVWNICDIEYPSGLVTAIDQFVEATLSNSILSLPHKK